MASTRSGRGRPRASKRRKISLRPRPASMRRVVCSVSSNVALPVLPEARIETRNEMRSLRGDDGKVRRLGKEKTWPVSHGGTEERGQKPTSKAPPSHFGDGHPENRWAILKI